MTVLFIDETFEGGVPDELYEHVFDWWSHSVCVIPNGPIRWGTDLQTADDDAFSRVLGLIRAPGRRLREQLRSQL